MNSIIGAVASLMLENTARETFLLRLRLYVQMIRGANAAISQHGMLEGSPAAVILTGPGYATVRRDAAQTDTGLTAATCTPTYRIDLHHGCAVVVSTGGVQRVVDAITAAF